MSQLIESGLTVTLIGMGTVFLLLTLLVWIVQLMSRISRQLGADSADAPAAVPAVPAVPEGGGEDQELVGVVGAAVRMYRNRHGRR